MIKNRLDKLRLKLKEKGLDAVLLTKRENYIYISGFTGTFAYVFVTQNDAILLTDFRYVSQAEKQADLFEVVEYKGKILDSIKEVLQSKDIEKLGFEDDYITYNKYEEMKKNLLVKELIPLGSIIDNLRIIKDEDEIETIKKAVKIADDAFFHILNYIKPGVREFEIAAEIEYFMKKSGAKGPSFETIVASGYRSALPHGTASFKKIEKNEGVTLDFGCIYKDYCSDMTRTVFVGQPKEELLDIYNVVLNAQKSALEKAAKGLSGREIDLVARDIISKNGYGENFGHGLGHGVGLEVHEKPRLSTKSDDVMENNMVVTIEPGIYVNGVGGVRIEDIIVINDNNPIVLTASSKEIIVL
ncbi:UNVERIFIED_CONTAM: Xaa-Pro aminopeptidase [Acetivibrio alkalicellulosi]